MAKTVAANTAEFDDALWLDWLDRAEALLGHSLDQEPDTISIDSAWNAFCAGDTVVDFALQARQA